MTIETKEKNLKVSLYDFMKALWSMNKDKFTQNENKCIKIAFSYNTEYNKDFTELSERLYRGETIEKFDIKVSKPIEKEHVESFRQGYLLILEMYAVNFLDKKKDKKEKKPVKDKKEIAHFFTNQLKVSSPKNDVEILKNLDKHSFSFLFYLLNKYDYKIAKGIERMDLSKINRKIDIDYTHVKQTLKRSNDNSFNGRVAKNIESLINTQFKINISKDIEKIFNIIESAERDIKTKKIKNITLSESCIEHVIPSLKKYVNVGVSVYDVLRLNKTPFEDLVMFKLLQIKASLKGSTFTQKIEILSEMFDYDISSREKKRRFKEILKRILERMKVDLKKVASYEIGVKDVVVKFGK